MKPTELITPDNKNVDGPGIYMILCLSNSKAYIGRSINIKRRWYGHKEHLRKNIHTNSYLQNCYNKYGKDSIIYLVIENCENLYERESFWANAIDPEYRLNLAAISDVVPISEETRKRLSESHKGIIPAHIPRVNWTGRKHTEASKKKMSETRKRKCQDPEFRKSISESAKKRSTPEFCKNMSRMKIEYYKLKREADAKTKACI